MGIGVLAVKFLKFPYWDTPALAFNNATSLPLLLIQSFQSTGILDELIVDDDDDSSALGRAESSVLVCAIAD